MSEDTTRPTSSLESQDSYRFTTIDLGDSNPEFSSGTGSWTTSQTYTVYPDYNDILERLARMEKILKPLLEEEISLEELAARIENIKKKKIEL